MLKKCQMCNNEFNAKRNNIKYCSECRIIKTQQINKKYREKNKEKRNVHNKMYREIHKEEIALRMKDYNKIYKETHKEDRKKYRKTKKEKDENYRVEQILRSKLHTFLKSKNIELYSDLIGCSLKHFKEWIEYNFTNQMNWNNYGTYWHMDHIIPVCIFDLTCEEEQKFCFNWKNTRPLEAILNISRKHNYFNILMHELKTHFYIRLNKEISNINYGVSNLQNQSRNLLMDLVNC
jgi:hypothetical protein